MAIPIFPEHELRSILAHINCKMMKKKKRKPKQKKLIASNLCSTKSLNAWGE